MKKDWKILKKQGGVNKWKSERESKPESKYEHKKKKIDGKRD